VMRLNALSGIGGVQTLPGPGRLGCECYVVLMPCRALEAFRRVPAGAPGRGQVSNVLMPCRALEAFRLP